MKRGWYALILPFLLGVSALRAQPPEEAGQRIRAFEEAIDVRVVNLEAVVTDWRGNRVTGLAAKDFKLLVDGVETPIAYFSEIAEERPAEPDSGAPEATWQSRNILVFLDESTMVKARRDFVLRALQGDLARLADGDRMAVVAFDGARLEVLTDWTGDEQRLAEVFTAVTSRPTWGIWEEARRASEAVNPRVPWADPFDFAEAAVPSRFFAGQSEPFEAAEAAASAMHALAPPPGRRMMLLLTEGFPDPVFTAPVVREANLLGYSLYPVDVYGNADLFGRQGVHHALGFMAAATGGKASINSNRMVALDRAVEDSSSYYLLGFAPAWKGDDGQHELKLTVGTPRLRVRTRKSYTDASHRTRLAREADGALRLGRMGEERRLVLTFGEPRGTGRRRELPVSLGVPVESLAFLPSERGYRAESPVSVVALETDGGRIELPGNWLQVDVAQLPLTGTYAKFDFIVKLKGSIERIVVTVHDALTGEALWGEARVETAARR
jgi:VWFA-related protein